jgi:hypothetical protein
MWRMYSLSASTRPRLRWSVTNCCGSFM